MKDIRRLAVLGLLVAGCASTPASSTAAAVVFHGSVADVESAATAAGFSCAPFSQPHGFSIIECTRDGQPERDLIDVYSRADSSIAGVDLIAESTSGGPAIAELAQLALAPVLAQPATSSLVSTIGSTAGTSPSPLPLAGGLELIVFSSGPGIDHATLLAPDLAAIWARPQSS